MLRFAPVLSKAEKARAADAISRYPLPGYAGSKNVLKRANAKTGYRIEPTSTHAPI